MIIKEENPKEEAKSPRYIRSGKVKMRFEVPLEF